MKAGATNPKYKTLMCRNINSPQGCSYGDRCQYAHSIQELRTFVGQIPQNQIENPNGQNMMQNTKQRNPLNYKTAKCRNFEQTGVCKYGSRCSFAHSDAELRTRMDNLNQMNRSLPNSLMMDYNIPQEQLGMAGLNLGQNNQGMDMGQLAMNGQFDPRTMFGMNQQGNIGGNIGQQNMGADVMQMQGQNMQNINLQGIQNMQNMQGMDNIQNMQNMQGINIPGMDNLNLQSIQAMNMQNMQGLQMQGMNDGIYDEANPNIAANPSGENAAANPNNP